MSIQIKNYYVKCRKPLNIFGAFCFFIRIDLRLWWLSFFCAANNNFWMKRKIFLEAAKWKWIGQLFYILTEFSIVSTTAKIILPLYFICSISENKSLTFGVFFFIEIRKNSNLNVMKNRWFPVQCNGNMFVYCGYSKMCDKSNQIFILFLFKKKLVPSTFTLKSCYFLNFSWLEIDKKNLCE